MRRYFTIPGWLIGMGIVFAYKYGKYKTEAKMYKKAEARAQAAEYTEETVEAPVEPTPEPAPTAEPEEAKPDTRKIVHDTIVDAVNTLLGVNGKDKDKG